MEPATATGNPPRKTRSDAKLEQLNPARRERLHAWFEEDYVSYEEVGRRVRAEFGFNVSKSAVSRYWRRHLLPEEHQDEAAIAATLAALPDADFDLATLHRAKALAWRMLTGEEPRVQAAATLLQFVHRAERLDLARQRVALEDRRVALREAQSTQAAPEGHEAKARAPKALSTPCSHGTSNEQLPPDPTPPPEHPNAILPSHQTTEPAGHDCDSIDEKPHPSSFPSLPSVQIREFEAPRFPGYSHLLPLPEGAAPLSVTDFQGPKTHNSIPSALARDQTPKTRSPVPAPAPDRPPPATPVPGPIVPRESSLVPPNEPGTAPSAPSDPSCNNSDVRSSPLPAQGPEPVEEDVRSSTPPPHSLAEALRHTAQHGKTWLERRDAWHVWLAHRAAQVGMSDLFPEFPAPTASALPPKSFS
jgi:hypothetical protein